METTTTRSIIIGAKPDRVYEACAELESLSPRLKDVRAVELTGERTSHWVADAPDGGTVEWETELTRLEPNERIAWSSTVESAERTSGQVTFNALPHDQTELTLILKVVTHDEKRAKELSARMEGLVDENLRALTSSIERPQG